MLVKLLIFNSHVTWNCFSQKLPEGSVTSSAECTWPLGVSSWAGSAYQNFFTEIGASYLWGRGPGPSPLNPPLVSLSLFSSVSKVIMLLLPSYTLSHIFLHQDADHHIDVWWVGLDHQVHFKVMRITGCFYPLPVHHHSSWPYLVSPVNHLYAYICCLCIVEHCHFVTVPDVFECFGLGCREGDKATLFHPAVPLKKNLNIFWWTLFFWANR